MSSLSLEKEVIIPVLIVATNVSDDWFHALMDIVRLPVLLKMMGMCNSLWGGQVTITHYRNNYLFTL